MLHAPSLAVPRTTPRARLRLPTAAAPGVLEFVLGPKQNHFQQFKSPKKSYEGKDSKYTFLRAIGRPMMAENQLETRRPHWKSGEFLPS